MDLYPVREWQEKNINVGVGGWDGGLGLVAHCNRHTKTLTKPSCCNMKR